MKYFVSFVIIFAAFTASFAQSDKIVDEIKKMDRQWQVESYSSKDLKDYDRIVADDFSMIGSNGKMISKSEKRANIAADYTEPSAAQTDSVFKIDGASHSVQLFKNTAISSGFIIEKYVYKGNKIDSRVYFTCAYLKRGGKWQMVAAQYARIKQS